MRTALPPLVSPLEVRFALFEALAATGDAGAADLIGPIAAELRQVAELHVPADHRQGFLRGVALHRRILQAESAQAARGTRVVRLADARGPR
jgi:hypothetical protein